MYENFSGQEVLFVCWKSYKIGHSDYGTSSILNVFYVFAESSFERHPTNFRVVAIILDKRIICMLCVYVLSDVCKMQEKRYLVLDDSPSVAQDKKKITYF